MIKSIRLVTVVSALLGLSGCVEKTYQPSIYENDICRVVKGNLGWTSALQRAEREYGLPPEIALSVISHESSFRSHARPPRDLVLGFIPVRMRTEYGYGQIKDETWHWYLDKNPALFRSRTSFADTLGFMGWYFQQYQSVVKPSEHLAYDFYLAYHEGLGGYQRLEAPNEWLHNKSTSVQELANRYQSALKSCI
jgi:hypothetical protein